MIDCHTHCYYSHDSKENPVNSINRAISLGLEYLAFTDHCDKDCLFVPAYKEKIRQIDLDGYFKELNSLKELYKNKIDIAVGIECGFMTQASNIYKEILDTYKTDITINSVHLVDFIDCYYKEYFEKKTKQEAYLNYISSIRKSLDVPYHYDVVAHIGYVSRKAIYEDKFFKYDDFKEQIDDILKTIIEKGKALEINSHAETTGDISLPNQQIIQRYKELGGELITFGSDAHVSAKICYMYKEIADMLQSCGFKYLFKYIDHKPIACKF